MARRTEAATVVELPTPSPVQASISTIVLTLLGAARKERQDLAPVIGVHPSGITDRLSGRTRWTPDDLGDMARYFATELDAPVEPGWFFRSPQEVLGQNRKKLTTADLHVLAGGVTATKGTSVQGRLRLLAPVP